MSLASVTAIAARAPMRDRARGSRARGSRARVSTTTRATRATHVKPALEIGSQGADVARLQQRLMDEGIVDVGTAEGCVCPFGIFEFTWQPWSFCSRSTRFRVHEKCGTV